METTMLLKTEGLPGPVMVKRLGKPATMTPRYVRGPAAHFCLRGRPARPRMSMRERAPVMASNPVAKTMLSSAIVIAGANAGGSDLLNGRAADVDQGDVVAVEGGVIISVNAKAFGAQRVILGHQFFGHCGIMDDLADFGAHEIGDSVVGLSVYDQVAVCAKQSDAATLPTLLVGELAFVGGAFESRFVV